MLVLGGCNVMGVSAQLEHVYDCRNMWYVSLPGLASPPFELPADPATRLQSHYASLMERERTKPYWPAFLAGEFDIVLLSVQHTHHDFGVAGDVVMPDFTGAFLLSDERLDGAPRPGIRDYLGPDAYLVDWRSDEFLGRLKASVDRLRPVLLEPWLRRGIRIVVHDHVLLREDMEAGGGRTPRGDAAEFAARDRITREVVEHLMRIPGLLRLTTYEPFNVSSDDAPWGRADVHPIEEQYVHLAGELTRLIGDDRRDELWRRHALKMRQRLIDKEAERRHVDDKLIEARTIIEQKSWDAEVARREMRALRRSWSWRLTAPLRVVRRQFRPAPKPASQPR